jgi:hypothetical protein
MGRCCSWCVAVVPCFESRGFGNSGTRRHYLPRNISIIAFWNANFLFGSLRLFDGLHGMCHGMVEGIKIVFGVSHSLPIFERVGDLSL